MLDWKARSPLLLVKEFQNSEIHVVGQSLQYFHNCLLLGTVALRN
jgi:hypothetical protein